MTRKRSQAVVVIDSRTMDIEQIYVGYSLHEAVQFFMKDLLVELDGRYDDSKTVMKEAMRRYTFSVIEPKRVSVRRVK